MMLGGGGGGGGGGVGLVHDVKVLGALLGCKQFTSFRNFLRKEDSVNSNLKSNEHCTGMNAINLDGKNKQQIKATCLLS